MEPPSIVPASLSRRSFLSLGLTAGLGAACGGRLLAAGEAAPVRLGFIGVGDRGTYLLGLALGFEAVSVTALCDLKPGRLEAAADLVAKGRGTRPVVYGAGPTDYRRLLARADVDAVVVGTPMQLHAAMSAEGLRARKHVLSEVAAAMTLEECWRLVRAAEASGKTYMLAENCCYYRQNLMVLRMMQEGAFGELAYAECGYVHDCRAIMFNADGSLTWRGEMMRDYAGNLYPTHALGPVCQWLGINRGDRLVSLVASGSPARSAARYAAQRFGASHPAARTRFRAGDTTSALLRTARGAVIDLRFDIASARPHPNTTYYTLQGAQAAYKDDGVEQSLWVEGRTKEYAWAPAATQGAAYEHPLWRRDAGKAAQSGHGGADYFVMAEFLEALRAGRPAPIDVYDAAAWSCVIPLTAASLRAGGAPQAIPDFTRGAWRTPRPRPAQTSSHSGLNTTRLPVRIASLALRTASVAR